MARRETATGGRGATRAVIPGGISLSVGMPTLSPPPGFNWTKLADLARMESGHTPSRGNADYWNGEIPWIGIRDATRNYGMTINTTNQYITHEGLKNSSARLLPSGTVCLSRTASVGYVIIMGVPMATSQDFVNWVCGPDLSPHYLRYLLMAEQESVRRFAHGSVHQTMYYPEAKALHVCIPERCVQDSIVDVLGALDDKIAANATLVKAADSLAKSMFAAILHETESLPLTKVARFVNGKAFTKGASGTGRVVIRIAELNSGISGSTVYSNSDVADQHLARPGDLLFAWSGSLTVCRWFRPEAIVNQHIFKVIPSSGYPIWCIYGLIAAKLDEFRAIAAGKATTMGHIQRRHLEEPVSVPNIAQIERHDTVMTALWERALLAEQESFSLAGIRDALLPRLMSGKIRVKDAEKTVEEVL